MVNKHKDWAFGVAQTLFDKKGLNILAIDIKKDSSMAHYVILADGNVERHVVALAKEVEKKMKKMGERPSHIEGLQHGDWVVLDYFELIIHLFTPEMRQKYQLERLWPNGEMVDLSLEERETMT